MLWMIAEDRRGVVSHPALVPRPSRSALEHAPHDPATGFHPEFPMDFPSAGFAYHTGTAASLQDALGGKIVAAKCETLAYLDGKV